MNVPALKAALTIASLLLALAVAAPTPADSIGKIPVAADQRAYLESAMTVIEAHSVRSGSIDWQQWRKGVLSQAQPNGTIEDAHEILESALQQLGDQHSFLLTPSQASQWVETPLSEIPAPAGLWLPGRVAYLRIGPVRTGDDDSATRYAEQVQALIARYDRAGAIAWVVDLRGNSGGNLWPMLAGLGPLLGDGTHGYFQGPDGDALAWRYEQGKALQESQVVTAVRSNGYQVKTDRPIAVLMDGITASSGEAMAISFRGAAHTRWFGQPSRGLTTSNENFELADGAVILLATRVYADRNGRPYDGPLMPDDLILPGARGAAPQDDPVVQGAVRWLQAEAISAGG